MANLIRFAQTGTKWTVNDLLAYTTLRSKLSRQTNPSVDHLDPALFTTLPGADDPDLSDPPARYLGYLDLATNATQESLLDDFARETLHFLSFSERNVSIHSTAPTDVCVLRPTLILLVLVEDKTLSNLNSPQSHAIVEAIAAYQFNNRKSEGRGLAPLESTTIPALPSGHGYRKLALQGFLAFKTSAKSHWQPILHDF
ncbi:hypothetical protein B0H10DRAFT_2174133 [Mycena sp. CBHHK59/15]|nr:hypothetical protein B0H10DRAFT_2174133 [Mycena sp. CBHHK59/15]